MSILLALWEFIGPIKSLLGYALAGLAIVWGLYAKGKSDAKNEMERKSLEGAFTNARERADIEDELVGSIDDELDGMLDDWVRD